MSIRYIPKMMKGWIGDCPIAASWNRVGTAGHRRRKLEQRTKTTSRLPECRLADAKGSRGPGGGVLICADGMASFGMDLDGGKIWKGSQ